MHRKCDKNLDTISMGLPNTNFISNYPNMDEMKDSLEYPKNEMDSSEITQINTSAGHLEKVSRYIKKLKYHSYTTNYRKSLLSNINTPVDLKNIEIKQLPTLANEIREFLVSNVSKTGGHIASNLGVVELTLALHSVFDCLKDKIVWDVGHQTYVHKILTERKDLFKKLRTFKGISGFPRVSESKYDSFNTGHSSTSVSAALGIARARDIKNEDHSVLAVIGDGALTGGMAYEAICDAGKSNTDLIVILNDNNMAISENTGGMSQYLNKLKDAQASTDTADNITKKNHPNYFEEIGFNYIGPLDGHNTQEMIDHLRIAKQEKGPILIHIQTKKGKGYNHAENDPELFHGMSPFNTETGKAHNSGDTSFSEVFGHELTEIAKNQPNVIAITAAMTMGTGLGEFSKQLPKRFFDVGIAEQHAVTLAAGFARNDIIPVFAVYSTFLQRAYDQVLHDVALQNLHVVFAIDRAGVVGKDGATHQGIYDLSYLRSIPNMTIAAPSDYTELRKLLRYGIKKHTGPIAIRYPKGKAANQLLQSAEVELGKGICVKAGTDLTIAVTGTMLSIALETREKLLKHDINTEIIYFRFVKPLDKDLLLQSIKKTKKLVTIEDNVLSGGFGSGVLEIVASEQLDITFRAFAFPDLPIEHGSREELFKEYGLDSDSIASTIIEMDK